MQGLFNRIPLKLFLALLVVQAGYWLVFHPLVISPPNPQGAIPLATSEASYARLDEPTWKAVERAEFAPIKSLPFAMERGYHASRASFELDTVPVEGLALLVADSADNREVWVNGSLLSGDGRMQLPDITFHGQARSMLRIPSGLLQAGENDVVTIAVTEFSEDGIMVPPVVGPYKSFERAFSWKVFLFGTAQIVSVTIGLVVIILTGIVLLRSAERGFLFWLMVMATAWSTNALLRIWSDMPLHGGWRTFAFTASALVLSLAWPMMIDFWTGRSNRWFQNACLTVFGVAALAIGWFNFFDNSIGAFETALSVLVWSGVPLLSAAFLRLILHSLRNPDDRPWEAALLLTMAMLFVISLSGAISDTIPSFYWQLTQPFFLLLFAIAFLGRNFRLFRSQEQIAGLLQTQLDERTAQLELAHARETELVREQAYYEERGRIMRDMHDGLGSNLMSMLLAARRGIAEPQAVAEGLQSVVDEMRLMIDSMDSVGESLATALATFRGRVADRVALAGFKLDWQDTAARPLPDYSPRAVLQVFRVMQEAVTNALKHSGGDVITITIADGTGDTALIIAIADNGGGSLGSTNSRGRGLGNMRSRAEVIGARLDFEERETGLTVRLELSEAAKAVA